MDDADVEAMLSGNWALALPWQGALLCASPAH